MPLPGDVRPKITKRKQPPSQAVYEARRTWGGRLLVELKSIRKDLAIAKAEHWYSVTPVVCNGRITGYDVQAIQKPESLVGVVSFGMG
jgi:hypothetical protein